MYGWPNHYSNNKDYQDICKALDVSGMSARGLPSAGGRSFTCTVGTCHGVTAARQKTAKQT